MSRGKMKDRQGAPGNVKRLKVQPPRRPRGPLDLFEGPLEGLPRLGDDDAQVAVARRIMRGEY